MNSDDMQPQASAASTGVVRFLTRVDRFYVLLSFVGAQSVNAIKVRR